MHIKLEEQNLLRRQAKNTGQLQAVCWVFLIPLKQLCAFLLVLLLQVSNTACFSLKDKWHWIR